MLAILKSYLSKDFSLQSDSIKLKFMIKWTVFLYRIQDMIFHYRVCGTRHCHGNQLKAAKHTAGSESKDGGSPS